MRKQIRSYFIPHKTNNYTPKLFDYAGLSAFLVVAIVLFMGTISVNKFVKNTGAGAAVYSSVLVDLTNKSRTENDQPVLVVSDKLTQAAQMKANDMAEKHYFAHTSPLGITPWFWFDEAHYPFTFAGENLAVDFTETKDVEDALFASPAHRENILDARFREIGIATSTAFFQGKETTFVVEMFGTPAVASTATTPVDAPAKKMVPTISTKKQKTTPPVALVESVKGVTSDEPSLAVITETPASIVVENQNATPSVVALAANTTSSSTPFSAALLHMPIFTHFALLLLAALLAIGLILFIFIEIKRQHPWRIFLGLLLLAVILFLAYATKSYYLIAV